MSIAAKIKKAITAIFTISRAIFAIVVHLVIIV